MIYILEEFKNSQGTGIDISKNAISIANKNIPNMVGQITSILANEKLNIEDLLNKSSGNIAYTIVDSSHLSLQSPSLQSHLSLPIHLNPMSQASHQVILYYKKMT